MQGDYVEKWYVKLLTVTSIKAVKCILPLLFDSPSYMSFLLQYRNYLHAYNAYVNALLGVDTIHILRKMIRKLMKLLTMSDDKFLGGTTQWRKKNTFFFK